MPLPAGPRPFVAVSLAAVLLAAASAIAANDVEHLFGQKMKPFIDPQGFYAVVFPSGFNCEARARNVECVGNRAGNASLIVRVVDTPASATPDIVLLNEMDRFKKKPHFKLVSKEYIKVDGSPAVVASFTYDYMGNVEYSIGVQAMYMVRQTKTYVIHFESHVGNFKLYQRDLQALYSTFKPARLDAAGNPLLEDLKPPEPTTDTNSLPDVDNALKSGF